MLDFERSGRREDDPHPWRDHGSSKPEGAGVAPFGASLARSARGNSSPLDAGSFPTRAVVPYFIDMRGRRFGRLTVIEEAGRRFGQVRWRCQCVCGNTILAPGYGLRRGATRSCGCLWRATVFRHGETRTRLYRAWRAMKGRCLNPRHTDFARCGGRGITICEAWTEDYLTFRAWARDAGYRDGLSLERINSDGNYEPGNCRWFKSPYDRRGNTTMTGRTRRTSVVADRAARAS